MSHVGFYLIIVTFLILMTTLILVVRCLTQNYRKEPTEVESRMIGASTNSINEISPMGSIVGAADVEHLDLSIKATKKFYQINSKAAVQTELDWEKI